MRLLLDTHVLLWWLDGGAMLSKVARAAIADADAEIHVSAVTAWEIGIKKRLGKLRAPGRLDRELAAHRFEALAITVAHAIALERLPDHHEDPFDRMLIAQATVEGLTLVTRDANIQKYRIPIMVA